VKRLVLLAAAMAALAVPAIAWAHPLGNFTTNRFSRVELSGNRVYVVYVLDLAEIPTYQARGEADRLGRDAYAARLAERLRSGLRLRIDGAVRPLTELRHAIAFPKGVGGLSTTRLEVVYDAGPAARGAAPLRLSYSDGNFANRIGWKEIVVEPDAGAVVAGASVPSSSVSDELRAYPKSKLASPLDVTSATATFTPGTAAGVPPTLLAANELEAPARVASASETGFASLISKDHLSAGVIALSLVLALFWGAAHALTPGHGKSIVAAYMVGSRGTARHAFLLGGIVTVTHTIGVFALGLVTLALSEFVVPETLYPWLNLVSAILVVAVGLAVLRLRVRAARPHAHAHAHAHHHHHGHTHVPARGRGLRGLVAVGVSGGLLPCPSALVVLLAAVSLHRVGYGLVLILAFSLGLAAAITGIGLLAVGAKSVFGRLSFEGRLVRALPAVSALVIIGLGIAMTVRTLPTIT
jgi:ABC-type nickel/cobalt efflux system permease component RcnA